MLPPGAGRIGLITREKGTGKITDQKKRGVGGKPLPGPISRTPGLCGAFRLACELRFHESQVPSPTVHPTHLVLLCGLRHWPLAK